MNRVKLLQLLIIASAAGAAIYATTTFSALQETIRVALQLSDNQMAVLQGPALYLPPMLMAVPLGFLIDHHSRPRLLVIFATLQLVGSLMTAFATDFTVLLVARALVGLMNTAIAMTVYVLIPQFVAAAERGRTMTMMLLFQLGGTSLAFAAGGKLATSYSTTPNGWHTAMLWLIAPLAIVLLATLLVREPRQRSAVVPINHLPLRQSCAQLWTYRRMLVPLVVAPVIVGLGDQAAVVWSGPLLSRRFGLPADQIGAMLGGILMMAGLLGSILGGFLADYCQRSGGPQRAISLLIGLVLLHGLTGLYGSLPSAISVTIAMFVFFAVNNIKGLVNTAVTTNVIPKEMLGMFFGLSGTIGLLFASISPLAVSALSSVMGGPLAIGRALAIVCVVASLLGVFVLAYGRRFLVTDDLKAGVST